MSSRINVRTVGCAIAVLLTVGASQAIRRIDSSLPPEAMAQDLMSEDHPDVHKAILLYTSALGRDTANPYRWSDLAAAYQADGEMTSARAAYNRALELSGQIPQIWLRVANFYFDLGEYKHAIPLAARVLSAVPDYDEVLFSYFDHLLPDPQLALGAVGSNRRALTAYIQHLIDSGDMASAIQFWGYMRKCGWNDTALTASYIDGMLRSRRYAGAQRDWVAFLARNAGDYPVRNLLYNGGFEREPSGSSLDWKIQPSGQFETVRDISNPHSGLRSLKIQFDGSDNVRYANVSQIARITPGLYSVSAWVRAEGVTTDEGVRLELLDAETPAQLVLKTAPVTGTAGWRRIAQNFTIGSRINLLMIRIVRYPSGKFDNKISGAVWIDDIAITRQ